MTARLVLVTTKRGRRVARVALTAGPSETRMLVGELRDLADGRLVIVESERGQPDAFLCRAGAASPTSLAEEQLAGLANDHYALLPCDPSLPPAAVLDPRTFEMFAPWVATLPG